MSFLRAGACLLGVLLFVCCPQRTFAQYSSPDEYMPPVTSAQQPADDQGAVVPPPEPVDFDEFSPLRTAMQKGDPSAGDGAPGADMSTRLKKLESDLKALQDKQKAASVVKYPNIKVSGFFQADYAWFSQDQANQATVGNMQDGWDFRRFRLTTRGNVAENVDWIAEVDFAASGRPSFRDTAMTVHELPVVGNFKAGYWRMPFGMDALTSARNFTFLERGLPQAFVPFRQIGMGLYNSYRDDRVTWATTVFRYPTDTFGGNIGDTGGYGFAGRVTMLPLWDEENCRLIHFGLGYSMANPSNNIIRYSTTPEFQDSAGGSLPGQLTGVPVFVDTGNMAAKNYNLFGVEAAAESGSLYAQSEFMWAQVNQLNGPVVTFPAGYGQVGYVLTGEHRIYDKPAAVFGGIKPFNNFGRDGWGAWEVATRLSYIDLNDANVHGGRLTDYTAGVNWFLNEFAKIEFNYIHAFLVRGPLGRSDADLMVVRVQVNF